MIGLFGIFASERIIDRNKRKNAFNKMARNINKHDFFNQSIVGKNFSIGITTRTIGENKDLTLKLVRENLVIGFCGYGKFVGEKKLFWANEMADRIVPFIEKEKKNKLTKIEGSFHCLIVFNNEIIIISDRFGSKNFYFCETKELFLCAPEVGSIVTSNLVPPEKNIVAAKQVLGCGFFLDDSTLIKGIKRFPYASILTKNISASLNSKSKITKYWTPPKKEGSINKITKDLMNIFSEKMKQAIYELADLEERAVVSLSGGLDSRTIACFLSKRQELSIVNYNLGDEFRLAKKVSNSLNGSFYHFTNKSIKTYFFEENLKNLILEQRIHAVLNQYFYAPLFKQYFSTNVDNVAIYDGIYMDILFSAPFTYTHFDFNECLKIYGNEIWTTEKFSYSIKKDTLKIIFKKKFDDISNYFNEYDAIGKSQLFYIEGRLRRYVNESQSSKENYCYVLKPGYNYDLMDFGFQLSLQLRKGLLYSRLLFNRFPDVMKIRFKDSYGNREKTIIEKLMSNYTKLRIELSLATHGKIKYSKTQADCFFLKWDKINNYKDLFFKSNSIKEIFADSQLFELFNSIKKKQYLFDYFQRVLFLQQFYSRYNT